MRAVAATVIVGAAGLLLLPHRVVAVVGGARLRARFIPSPIPAAPDRRIRRALRVGLGVAVTALIATAGFGPVGGCAAAACAGLAASGLRAAGRARAASVRASAEVEFLTAFAAELRSGRHPAAALAAVPAPADAQLAAVVAAAKATADLGGDVSACLRRSPNGSMLPKLAAAWQLSEDCGAPLADTVAQVSGDIRAIADLERSAEVELTGARATGLMLAVLPLLGVALGGVMGAHPVHVLLRTPAGAVCVAGGLAFEVAGLSWVRRLTDSGRALGG